MEKLRRRHRRERTYPGPSIQYAASVRPGACKHCHGALERDDDEILGMGWTCVNCGRPERAPVSGGVEAA